MPDDVKTSGLYEQDFYAWAVQQAQAIGAARAALADRPINDWRDSLAELDWENLAEEIGSSGRSERHELGNRIETVIEHLAKLEFINVVEPRAGWQDTIERSRGRIDRLLRASPSLRNAVPDLIEEVAEGAMQLAVHSLARHGEDVAAVVARLIARRFTQDQILTAWWPDATSRSEPSA